MIQCSSSKVPPFIIFWFRRDLRLSDNHGLSEAISAAQERGFRVLPIFIFDDAILKGLPKNDARVSFIYSCLQSMKADLSEECKALQIHYDTPDNVFSQLIKKYDIRAVFCNHDYEPLAMKRDLAVKALLNESGVAFRHFKDQVIFEKNDIVKADGKPYTVFTPFKKRWLQYFDSVNDVAEYPVNRSLLVDKEMIVDTATPTLLDIGFEQSSIVVLPYTFSGLGSYDNDRDFPALEGTSRLSVHLRFGTISVRQAVKQALIANDTLLSELIWREFFMQILWHFPYVVEKSFRPAYDRIEWLNREEDFKAWCAGETGYPFVDAGMRELNNTGHMHNRVRMVTASFLCKHLLIDWRWGERYFAEKLLDYELSANNGNWQWAAGSGCDAAPYFRIFNPMTQATKFDPDRKYICQYVPEVDKYSYARPIVDHKEARERCLAAYAVVKG